MVLSANTETMETGYKPVVETYVRKVDKLVHLTVNGEEIITTVDHPFYVNGQGFVNAVDLCIGSQLVDNNGNILKVDQIFRESLHDETCDVYNFKVDEWHTYFVSNHEILVHNAECGGAYKDVKKKNAKENHGKVKRDQKDAHHMPAHDAYPDDIQKKIGTVGSGKKQKVNGPSISMINSDHTQTASYDNKPGAKAYRAKQKNLIEQGKFQEAFDMDVADIKSKFPEKYDLSIQQAQDCLNDIIEKVKNKNE